MCSADLKDFIEKYHLNLAMDGVLNPRDAFGSHDDSDHVYNTPRAWYMEPLPESAHMALGWTGMQITHHIPTIFHGAWCLKRKSP